MPEIFLPQASPHLKWLLFREGRGRRGNRTVEEKQMNYVSHIVQAGPSHTSQCAEERKRTVEFPLVRKHFEGLGFPADLSFFLPPRLSIQRAAGQSSRFRGNKAQTRPSAWGCLLAVTFHSSLRSIITHHGA